MEQEVDRIIDSQDNEYVLSRPKCAPRLLVEVAECGWCASARQSAVWCPAYGRFMECGNAEL